MFGKCCDLNIANINRPLPATTYPATPKHCKNISTIIPFHQPPSSTQTPKKHQNHHQPFKTQPSKPPPATTKASKNCHQLPKQQPPTTCYPIPSATIIYPNTQEPLESPPTTKSPPTIQNTAIKTTINHLQSFKKLSPTTQKKQPPTTQKTTINNPKIHIRKAKTPI